MLVVHLQSPRPVRLPGGAWYPSFQWPLDKHMDPVNWSYLVALLLAARLAAAPAWLAELSTCFCICVWHSNIPSQRLASGPWKNGKAMGTFAVLAHQAHWSFEGRIWACLKALQMMSFRRWWRCCLDALLWQSRPWRPHASNVLLHAHLVLLLLTV